jgi:predicted nucleotidyltransferase
MSDSVLVSIDRDPLFGMSPESYRDWLKRTLEGRVKEAYLFGSFVTGPFTKFSDIDLLLITDTVRPFVERPLDFTDLLDAVPTTDILVYTPEEFARLMTEEQGFWRGVRETMERIV